MQVVLTWRITGGLCMLTSTLPLLQPEHTPNRPAPPLAGRLRRRHWPGEIRQHQVPRQRAQAGCRRHRRHGEPGSAKQPGGWDHCSVAMLDLERHPDRQAPCPFVIACTAPLHVARCCCRACAQVLHKCVIALSHCSTKRFPRCLIPQVRALKMHGGGPPVVAGTPLAHEYKAENVPLVTAGCVRSCAS